MEKEQYHLRGTCLQHKIVEQEGGIRLSGVKGRSGRKKTATNTVKYFNECFDKKSYQLIEKLFEFALDGDKNLLQYVFDRRLGKPHQSQDLRVRAERVYSPDELQLMSQPLLDEAKLLNGWAEGEADTENTKDPFQVDNKGEDNV